MEHIEPFNGGVVNTKDADTLAPGELVSAGNFLYLSDLDNIVRGPAFATATVRANPGIVYGMAPLTFDNGNNWLVAMFEDKYQYASITPTTGALGTWTDLATHAATSTARNGFSAVHYNNKYYLLDGVQENIVVRQDGTTRKHGLKPVITALPTIVTSTATGNSWPAQATGYFDYWFTEVMKIATSPEDIIVESAYECTTTDSNESKPAVPGVHVGGPNAVAAKIITTGIQVTALNTQATVSIPARPRNSQATHYRLYRSQVKTTSTDPSFPIGELIGEVAIPSANSSGEADQFIDIIDGAVTTSNYGYAAATATATGWTNPGNAVGNAASFNSGTYATASLQIGTGAGANDYYDEISVKTFDLASVITLDPISGIEVEVRGKIAASVGSINTCQVETQVSFDSGSTWSSWVSLGKFTTSDTTLSSGMRNWGRNAITREDIITSAFYVKVKVSIRSNSSTPRTSTVSIDGIRARGNYSGSAAIMTQPYPGIVLTQGKIEYVTSRNGEPPPAKTGCIFQGSLVCDDKNAPSLLRWSMPGDPEAFPALYYLPIETKNNDTITFIGMVNNICVVGLKNAIVRLNYLPTEDDSSFSRSRIYDFISTDLGILHHRAACTFLTPGGRELLAMMTQDGIYVTDGYSINKWDGDYSTVASILGTMSDAGIVLYNCKYLQMANDISSGNIMVTYQVGLSDVSRTVPFNYSPRHLKQGPRFKVGGVLIDGAAYNGCGNVSAVTTNGVPVLYIYHNPLAGNSDVVTLKQLGRALYTAHTANTPTITTRKITFNNGTEEAVINEVLLNASSSSGMSDMTCQVRTTLLDTAATHNSNAVAFQGGAISKADFNFEAYSTQFVFSAGGTALHKLNRFLVDFTRFGQKGSRSE